jgi:hypothetical protein
VESGDGEQVAYSTWQQLAEIKHGEKGQGLSVGQAIGIPSIRVLDTSTGLSRTIARGAHAPALSSDGRLAFMKGDAAVVRHNRPRYGSHVPSFVVSGPVAVSRDATPSPRLTPVTAF